jgi:hypothetical protein
MTSHSASRFLRPALVVVALTAGPAAAADKTVAVSAASVPKGTDSRIKRALSDAVRAQVSQAGLSKELRGYNIVPALIRLRAVADERQGGEGTECIVELSLQHVERGLVAHVRGSATGFGATRLDTVQAAAGSAVQRLPEILSALQN